MSGHYHKKCPRIPRNQLPPGYFYTNMGACTPQPTFTGVFLHNMGVYAPQPALTGVFPHKYGCLYPAANFYRGISTQIWVPVPRSQLSPGYFRTNTGAYTPQSTFTGVFLYKYGCLCPAVNFHWGIFVQIWVSIPRSQLLPGYFCANMGVCTPLPAPARVFPRKNGYLYPGTPAPYQNFHTLSQILHIFSIPF